MANASGPARELNLLFTCVGRRVELLQAFRAAARRLNVRLRIVGVDNDVTAPAMHIVDEPIIVPRIADAGYADAVLDAIARFNVAALIPTIDTDLTLLSQSRERLAAAGCIPLIAEPAVIDICRNKERTYAHLRQHQIDTPQTWLPAELPPAGQRRFPLFIKPRTGSASRWVQRLDNEAELQFHLDHVRDPIIQEFVTGVEHTLDVYVGLTGQVHCVVPRARWQVRTGEVAKGVVVKDSEIMAAGKRVVESLGPSPRGLVTLQCIVTPEHRIRFIEINPRFGGGAPLGIAAGADYPGWLIQELLGETPTIAFDGFRHGTCMLRYDWSVFVPLDDTLTPRLAPPLRPPPDFA